MNASTNHRPPVIHASPFDKAARSENEFTPNPPQEVHYEAKPLSRPVRNRAGWIEIPIRWHTLVKCSDT